MVASTWFIKLDLLSGKWLVTSWFGEFNFYAYQQTNIDLNELL